MSSIREYTDLPVVVGFGISKPEQVREVAKVADGVVVGSALVNCISQNLDSRENILSSISAKTKSLTGALVAK